MRSRAAFVFAVIWCACTPSALPDRDLAYWSDEAGQPIAGLDAPTLALFERGREVMVRTFNPATGLGPHFNTDSCAGCHQFPTAGGSAPRYRDFFLVRAERPDGVLVDAGTNGTSPVHNLYSLEVGHTPVDAKASAFARRNTPSFLGVGLFEFVADEEILARSDPDDSNGDGISGRANYEQGELGRFGYKSQAASVESFNRGALINQMGITSRPLRYHFAPPRQASLLERSWRGLREAAVGLAHAQVAAPDRPTTDSDEVPDPEISDEDQLALLIFSTFVAPLRPAEADAQIEAGARLFARLGCADCHVPALDSELGPLYAYTDLLVHDMGEDFAADHEVSLATPSEFRTQPLWGVALHGPWLHDGRADSLHEAIALHGGEAEASAQAYLDRDDDDQAQLLAFLESLGGWSAEGLNLVQPGGSSFAFGTPGGPDTELHGEDRARWERGQAVFDRSARLDRGLGRFFNADACRACHRDPVLGGAGGVDTNVIRFGRWDGSEFHGFDRGVVQRAVVPGLTPYRMDDEANVVEWRNPPTSLGVGLLDRIPRPAIEAHADPDDTDGDGISGYARELPDGRLGRFGWKAQVPSLADFAADGLLNELGLTVAVDLSSFTAADDGDTVPDPELERASYEDLVYYLQHLAPPVPRPPTDASAAARGETLFASLGCADCHLPSLHGVPAYTDLLLHDVVPEGVPVVDQEWDLLPTEFRTPPLWGVVDTAPYLHDARAWTLQDAVLGHGGEAQRARDGYEALQPDEQADLVVFLKAL
jgi:CxxC motif-containing protein (DUF1111 family)